MQEPGARIIQYLIARRLQLEMQKSQSDIAIFLHSSQSRLILRASFGRKTQKTILAALAMKEDTIPKPDGLAMVTQSTEIERNSDNVELCSKMIEDCSQCVRGSRNLPEGLPTAQSTTRQRFAGRPTRTPDYRFRTRMPLESASAISPGRCAENAMRESFVFDSSIYGRMHSRPPSREMPWTDSPRRESPRQLFPVHRQSRTSMETRTRCRYSEMGCSATGCCRTQQAAPERP